jgi:RimJ/RimL family protein N-acetyltransferase
MVQLPLRTARLLLRPVHDADLPQLLSILGDGEVMRLALYERALKRDEAQDFIDADFTRSADDVTHLGVLCGNDRAILGFAGLLPCKYFPGDLEIGFVLGREHQGHGYATEIGRKLLDVGFDALHRPRLLGLCDPENAGSRHVLLKLGMSEISEITTPDRGRRVVYEIKNSGR